MYKLLLVMLTLLTQACAASFSIATPREVVMAIDTRPRVEIIYNGNDVDVMDIEANGTTIVTGARAGQTIGFPVYSRNQWGEQRTFWAKGYRLVPDTAKNAPSGATVRAYVGMRCKQIYIARGQQPQPWVIDQFAPTGSNSTGCW